MTGVSLAQKHLMIAINWYGPYADLDEARLCARHDYDHGLYLAIGRVGRETSSTMQYVGIGSAIYTRLTKRHHALSKLADGYTLWLGEIVTAEPSGTRLKATRTTLDLAEWLHARFLRLPLNKMKTREVPSRSVTVLNRWFRKDYETPYVRRPHPDWPDLIDFPCFDRPARAVWFGARQRTFKAPEYALPPSALVE